MEKHTKCVSEVYCTLQLEGTHFWKDCPIEEVNYLALNHRHVFHVKAYKKVNHDDRDVEFIWLKHEIQKYMNAAYFCPTKRLHVFGGKSCEMLAQELIDQFGLSRCEVNEDNENGAILTAVEDE